MKQRIYTLLFGLFFSTLLFAQQSIDKKLVGFWSSIISKTKEDPIEGKWLINRKADGTFAMYLEILNNNDTIYAKQKGKWWTENGNYFEEGDVEYGDIYTYKTDGNKIDFRLIKNRLPQGFKTVKYSEVKAKDQSDYYEEKYSVFSAKTLQKTFEMEDKINGFSYDELDGTQDARLVGVWTGSEKDNQIEGVSKEWEMTRNTDGTFVLDFRVIQKGKKMQSHIEKGKWWVRDNKFYEYHEDSEMTDVYTFEVLNGNQIKFKEYNLSVDQNKSNYEFIDTRKK